MSIVLATTTITIKGNRPQSPVDPSAVGYDAAPFPLPTLVTRVRACIGLPTSHNNQDGAVNISEHSLMCDPVDVGLSVYDLVVDDTTGVEYSVQSVSSSVATFLGLNHIVATLRETKGLADESLTVTR